MGSSAFLRRAMDVARAAALAAGKVSLGYWRIAGARRAPLLGLRWKDDGSPVTRADRAAEAAILRVVRRAFPRHDVIAEEGGAMGEGSRWRWVVDPLDGTRGFARGGSMWGPLVALEDGGNGGEVVAGAMALPALGVAYWAAKGLGCWRDGERCRVSRVRRWADATLSLGGMRRLLLGPHGKAVRGLFETASSARAYGDLAACAMLLDGAADCWLEDGVRLWDLAAGKILVEEAGGRFTDFSGRDTPASGNAVATNGLLHRHVLAALAGATPSRAGRGWPSRRGGRRRPS